MHSTFGWLSYDDSERRRTQEIIETLRERGTTDELGFGVVRDFFRDQLFPGTSTLHTRARYFTFLPRILAETISRYPATEFESRFRRAEQDLIEALKIRDENQNGIIGAAAGRSLRRYPSSAYWASLQRYGLITKNVSLSRLSQTAAAQRREVNSNPRTDDENVGIYGIAPAAASGWLSENWRRKGVSFTFAPDESDFLKERIITSTKGSLYSWFLNNEVDPGEAKTPWDHPDKAEFDDNTQVILEHARGFHHLARSATIIYNFAVSTLVKDAELADKYRADFSAWRETAEPVISQWNSAEFRNLLLQSDRRVSPLTLRFYEEWWALASAQPAAFSFRNASERIAKREWDTKQSRARLHSPSARDNWEGDVGMFNLTYNWDVMRRMVQDLQGEANHAEP